MKEVGENNLPVNNASSAFKEEQLNREFLSVLWIWGHDLENRDISGGSGKSIKTNPQGRDWLAFI